MPSELCNALTTFQHLINRCYLQQHIKAWSWGCQVYHHTWFLQGILGGSSRGDRPTLESVSNTSITLPVHDNAIRTTWSTGQFPEIDGQNTPRLWPLQYCLRRWHGDLQQHSGGACPTFFIGAQGDLEGWTDPQLCKMWLGKAGDLVPRVPTRTTGPSYVWWAGTDASHPNSQQLQPHSQLWSVWTRRIQ